MTVNKTKLNFEQSTINKFARRADYPIIFNSKLEHREYLENSNFQKLLASTNYICIYNIYTYDKKDIYE